MRKLILCGVAGLLALAFAAPATSSAASDYFMKIQGVGETSPGSGKGCIECTPPHANFIGPGDCTVCLAFKPTSGTVSIRTVVITPAHHRCRIKSVAGTVEVNWNDGSISTGELAGKLGGSKLKLGGVFSPSDPLFAADPVKVVLNAYPPSPCVSTSNPVTGTMRITVR
jgi:hypothetical protein